MTQNQDAEHVRLTSVGISLATSRQLSAMVGRINRERKDAEMVPLRMFDIVTEACEAWMKENHWMIENGVNDSKI